MNAQAPRRYRFGTPAQWQACLFDGVDRPGVNRDGVIRPVAPYAGIAQHFGTGPAHAPAVTADGTVLWCGAGNRLFRLAPGAAVPEEDAAPLAIATAARVVPAMDDLWIAGQPAGTLARYDATTLEPGQSVVIPGARVADLTADGTAMVYAMVDRGGSMQAAQVDRAGQVVRTVTFDGVTGATAFVFLREAQRFVVLAGARLYWFGAAGGAPVRSIATAAARPCFLATHLGGDGRGRVFLAGRDGLAGATGPFVLAFDGDGEALDEVALEVAATGVAGGRDALFVTSQSGLLRYPVAQAVPAARPQVRCTVVTPALAAPVRDDGRRWLRVEARATLPDGATLDIAWAGTDDAALHRELAALAGDDGVLASLRANRLRDVTGLWRQSVAFQGQGTSVATPLFEAQGRYLWVAVTLTATAGGALPTLAELGVLYAGPTLMDSLPAIYRRPQAQAGNFLRMLVGALETTTQGFDARIGAMARHIHPDSADGPWLDFVASWLGLPWDDALDGHRKRRLLAHAAELAEGRGTRAGLEAMLACVLPGAPPPFRVTEPGSAILGSRLPALLAGRPPSTSVLGAGTALGRMRLRKDGKSARRIVIALNASPRQRRAWEPWLAALAAQMMPVTVRAQLRWRSTAARMGEDAVLGAAELG